MRQLRELVEHHGKSSVDVLTRQRPDPGRDTGERDLHDGRH
jgi:hypothetical protein